MHVVRLKNIRAAVWGNETEMGTRYNVTVSRLYKGEDQQWGTSESFGRDDLLLLRLPRALFRHIASSGVRSTCDSPRSAEADHGQEDHQVLPETADPGTRLCWSAPYRG